jgi:hypothetical protein
MWTPRPHAKITTGTAKPSSAFPSPGRARPMPMPPS